MPATVRAPEPAADDERGVLSGWLAFHRDALAAKCDGLSPDRLVETAVPPSTLSLLGLVRHMTEMERVYGAYALGGPRGSLRLVYCTDDDPEADIEGIDASMVGPSMAAWQAERASVDELLAAAALDDPAVGNRRSVRWNVAKLLQEYARHNGHADLIRQAIDGAVGE